MPIRLGRDEIEDDLNRNAPQCPNCGAKMRYKSYDYGDIYKCSRCKEKKFVGGCSTPARGYLEDYSDHQGYFSSDIDAGDYSSDPSRDLDFYVY